jgi:hypothetical protein
MNASPAPARFLPHSHLEVKIAEVINALAENRTHDLTLYVKALDWCASELAQADPQRDTEGWREWALIKASQRAGKD